MTPDQVLQIQVDNVRELIKEWRAEGHILLRGVADEVAAALGDERLMP